MIRSLAQKYTPALAQWWERLSPRESFLVATAVLVVASALGWAFMARPMLADIARLQRDQVRMHTVLAAVQAQAGDLTALARATPVAGSDPRAALERAIAESGLRPALTAIDTHEGRVRVLFNGVRFDALAKLLEALARADGVRLVEATLTTRVEAGTVRAELSFVRG